MKKKILCILLSLAMVVTMMPAMAMTICAADETIGSLLNVASFPTQATAGEIPNDVWECQNGGYAYKTTDKLVIDSIDKFEYSLDSVVTPVASGYSFTKDGLTLTFNYEGNVLKNFLFKGNTENAEYNNTFKPCVNEIDLTGYNLGEGWTGKKGSDIISQFNGFNKNYCTYVDAAIFDAEGNCMDDIALEGDKEYTLKLELKADENHYFLSQKSTYKGNIIGQTAEKVLLANSLIEIRGLSRTLPGVQYIVMEFKFTTPAEPIPDETKEWPRILKIAAIAAGAAAVVGVVGTVVKNVQKAVVANQMAFQAKMQQQMVQKQVASIKTVLKGAGVVLSLASFGSSLGKLFQLNQFGFNQFGFNQFGFK